MITINNECKPCVNDDDANPSDCPCGMEEHIVHEGETLDLTFSADIDKVFIVVVGSGATINFPAISTVVERGVEVFIMCTFTGTITINPNVANSLGNTGIGIAINGNVIPGDSGVFWVGSPTYWGIATSGGGAGVASSNFAFTTTNGQQIYTLAQIIAALVSGSVSNLTGKTFIVHHAGVSYISGGGDITINGSGGFDFNFDPGTNTCVVQII